ncbi:MAG: hypothetical protein JSW31_03875 [Burkholderiales bacterium]|nr:MAG: hypothetical protein JSW31_03875 [Burkholderiales bacterium]
MIRSSLYRAQRGASALVALVFLVIVAFVVLTAYRLSGQQLMLAGNAQSRAQALAATNFALERTISTVDFLRTPAVVAATPVGVDIDGNGADDLDVTVGMPVCYRLRVVPQAELDERRAGDVGCIGGAGPAGSTLVIGASGGASGATGESQCADSEWNISATYADAVTGSALTVNQGVAVRADRIDAANNCT